jgi:peptidoglycan/LPS O-acetylase OafA/YrhL
MADHSESRVKRTRVTEIDLLRFLAAVSVLLFHYTFSGYAAENLSPMPYTPLAPISKYGWLGIELFFVISGFVILMTAVGRSLRSFVVSRLIRLYPAFWACCTITFALILAFGAPRITATVGQYFINMTMLAGFVGEPDIDGAYWSLYVEMRFYFLVAVVLATGRIQQVQTLLLAWLAAVIVLEFIPFGPLRYLLIVEWATYFIAGATFYLVWAQGISPMRVCMIVVSWGLALYQTIKALPVLENHYNASMSGVIVAAIISAFYLAMFLIALNRTGHFGRINWILVGALTYPLYLLHGNIGYIFFNIGYPEINPHLLLWSTIFVVLCLAYAVHIGIERKFARPMKIALNRLLDFLARCMNRRKTHPAE